MDFNASRLFIVFPPWNFAAHSLNGGYSAARRALLNKLFVFLLSFSRFLAGFRNIANSATDGQGKRPSPAACNSARNADLPVVSAQLVRIAHPFHPFAGRQFVSKGERSSGSRT
jgi:hypothetical protein